jgi:anthranilate/para-aminobenzoate synthase component I
VYDHAEAAWHAVGPFDDAVLDRIRHGSPAPCPPLRTGAWSGAPDPDAHLAAVARVLDYIAAGDVFQVNVTRRLSAPYAGAPRALALAALARSGAWFGAFLELPEGRSIVSMSPELFLRVRGATAEVVTRPIKGTRPSRVAPRELAESAKDQAELNMIIDLMRNDLGRVCRYGSIRVTAARAIETHGTVHHGVGEVRGVLREGVGIGALLEATFPAGSITGAPKIRAMQIIEELEPVRRGPYCGAIGYFGDDGDVCLNVAIRTVALTAAAADDGTGTLDYGVGGGIVADSDPVAELSETEDKAAVLRVALGEAGKAPATPSVP